MFFCNFSFLIYCILFIYSAVTGTLLFSFLNILHLSLPKPSYPQQVCFAKPSCPQQVCFTKPSEPQQVCYTNLQELLATLFYHSISSIGVGLSLTDISLMAPFLTLITLFPIGVKAILCVITTTVTPLLIHIFCSSFNTDFPV